MISVEVVEQIEDIERLRAPWHALLRETQGATFFHTPEWLECYWRHYGGEQSLRVVLVQEHGAPLGILPLVIRRESTKVGTVRYLTYPLAYWGSFYGPIGPRPAETLRHGLEELRRSGRDWDAIELRWIDHEGTDRGETAQVMTECELPPITHVRQETALIDLAGTWDDYLAAHSSKWRNNFRRWTRRLAEQGTVEYRRYRPAGRAAGDEDPRWELYDACEAIAHSSWQGSSTDGTTLSHEAVRPYMRDAHATAARLGCLDLNMLYLNEQPIAFAYNYHFQGSVFGLRIGYDPATASAGVGNLMYLHAIQDSFQRGDRLYDMGPGSLECKRDLLTRVQPIYFCSYFEPRSLRAQLLRMKRLIDVRRSAAPATTAAVLESSTIASH